MCDVCPVNVQLTSQVLLQYIFERFYKKKTFFEYQIQSYCCKQNYTVDIFLAYLIWFRRVSCRHTESTFQYNHWLLSILQVIDYGNTVRSTGSTGVNADSSRSHAILQLEVKGENGTKQVGRYSKSDWALDLNVR